MFDLVNTVTPQGTTATATRRLALDSAGNVVEGTDPSRATLFCITGDLIPVEVARRFKMLPGQEAEATEEGETDESADDSAKDDAAGTKGKKKGQSAGANATPEANA